MERSKIIELASDSNISEAQLRSFANIDFEINRLIAANKNSSDSLLVNILNFTIGDAGPDKETQRIIARNPNISKDLLLYLSKDFPADVVVNPLFHLSLKEDPDFIDLMPHLYEMEFCPNEVFYHIEKNGTIWQKFSILKNDILPCELRKRLGPESFIKESELTLKNLVDQTDELDLKKDLLTFSKLSLPYCLPKFKPLKPDCLLDRTSDQVVNGFPYTSFEWPWPTSSIGEYLPLIVQLNLAKVSNLLRFNYGNGLLQVWGNYEGEKFDPVIRIIPEDALRKDMDISMPIDMMSNSDIFPSSMLSFANSVYINSGYQKIEWVPMGKMYIPSNTDTLSLAAYQGLEWKSDVLDLSDKLEDVPVPSLLQNYFSTPCQEIMLGGFGYVDSSDCKAFALPSSQRNLIFRIEDEFVSFSVVHNRDTEAESRFEVFRFFSSCY